MTLTLLSPPQTPARSPLIQREDRWRHPGLSSHSPTTTDAGKIALTRWLHHGEGPLEASNDGCGTFHCISLNLKCASLMFHHAGRKLVHDLALKDFSCDHCAGGVRRSPILAPVVRSVRLKVSVCFGKSGAEVVP